MSFGPQCIINVLGSMNLCWSRITLASCIVGHLRYSVVELGHNSVGFMFLPLESQRITVLAFISVTETFSFVFCVRLFGMFGFSLSRAEKWFWVVMEGMWRVSRGGLGWVGCDSVVDEGSVVLSVGANWWEGSLVDRGIATFSLKSLHKVMALFTLFSIVAFVYVRF